MSVPGMNLLGLAQGLIAPQRVQLAKFQARATNGAGYQVPSYAAPVEIEGGLQPVPQTRYEALGLDFAKTYATLYTLADVVGVARDGTGDRLTYNGETYAAESLTNWRPQDGWVAIICVKVAP